MTEKLTLRGRIAAEDPLLDTDLRDLEIITGPEGTYLCAMTGQNGGISVYQVENGRLAALHDSAYFSISGIGVGTFSAIEMKDRVQLIMDGAGAGKMLRYTLNEAGELGGPGNFDLPGNGDQSHAVMVSHGLKNGRDALFTVDADTGILGGWRTDDTGKINAAIKTRGKADDFELGPDVALETTKVGKAAFLLATESGGVHAYKINKSSGSIREKDSLGAEDGLGIAEPVAVETVSAFGETWVLVAASGSQTLSVMKLSPKGELTLVDHLLDTLATRFGGVAAMEVVKFQGHVLVIAGGADDGLSLFELLPDGRLAHLDTLAHDIGLGLENVSAIKAVARGDALEIFVTSGSEAGISQFTMESDSLGRLVYQEGTARGPLAGTSGDDILVASAAGGVLTGGKGADHFVLNLSEQSLKITDFTAGEDSIDLSAFPMLRSTAQLAVKETDTGIILEFADTRIEVKSATGTSLTLSDLWPEGFSTPDRIPLPTGPMKTLISGTKGKDELEGGKGNDTIKGRGGDDRLIGNDGADRLMGHGGDDQLKGGGGADEFHFAKKHGDDRISDFKLGDDLLVLHMNAEDFSDLDITDTQEGAVIDTGEGTITLEGIKAKDIGDDDVML